MSLPPGYTVDPLPPGYTVDQKPSPPPTSKSPKTIKAIKAIAGGAPIVGREPWLLSALQAPGRELSHFVATGGLSGYKETPAQNEADLEKLGTQVIPYGENLPPGVRQFAAGTVFDPLTYAGGTGLLKNVATRAGLASIPKIAAAAAKIPAIQTVYDYAVFGGKLKRDLAPLLSPQQAATWFAHARAAKSIGNVAREEAIEGGSAKDFAEKLGLSTARKEFLERAKPLIDELVHQAGKLDKAGKKALKAKTQLLNDAVDDFISTTKHGALHDAAQANNPLGLILRGMRKAIDLPKQVLIGFSPLRHMQNIGFLGAMHYPQALPKVAVNFARALASPQVRESIIKHAAEQGLTSGRQAESTDFGKWLARVPFLARSLGGAAAGGYSGYQQGGGTGAAVGAVAGAGLGAVAPKWYAVSSRILWTFDHVMKGTALDFVAKQYMRKGLSEADAFARAAKDVGDRLVNYDERSPLVKDLRHFMPFATWNVKVVGSILRGLSEHPERAMAVLRGYPAFAGEYQKTGDVQIIRSKPHISTKTGRVTIPKAKVEKLGARSSTPLAEFARRTSDPGAWLRSSLGYPYQAALGGMESLAHNQHPYFTYGRNPLQWLVEGATNVPGMPSAFGDPFLDSLIFGQTGITQGALPKP